MPLTEKQLLDYIEAVNKKGKDGWREVIYYSLFEKFIEKYIDKLDIDLIFIYQTVSYEFKEKYKNFVTFDNRRNPHCFFCGIKNTICSYKVNGKGIYDRRVKVYNYYYCPKCLR